MMTGTESLIQSLEDGSYWVEQQQVVTFLLSTIERCAAESPLHGLPHEILQSIAQMAFRPRHRIRFEWLEQDMPPLAVETWLARDGQCLVFPCPPQRRGWCGDEEPIPYPTIQLPTVGYILYFELHIDHSESHSEIHVHDVVFAIDGDERYAGGYECRTPDIDGTAVMPWIRPVALWGPGYCGALDNMSVMQRLTPWQREFNYAVNRPFWRHLTTGDTSWHPPPAAPLDWRSFFPCECEPSYHPTTAGCSRLTLGLLVDLSAGFVTFRLNQVNGPRVPLGAGWEDGVEVCFNGHWRTQPDVERGTDAWQVAIEQPLRVPDGLYEASSLSSLAALPLLTQW